VIARAQVAGGGVPAELDRFGVLLLAQHSVVQHPDDERDPRAGRGLGFGPAVGEAAVADYGDCPVLRTGGGSPG
jgi:hypothetical protein